MTITKQTFLDSGTLENLQTILDNLEHLNKQNNVEINNSGIKIISKMEFMTTDIKYNLLLLIRKYYKE